MGDSVALWQLSPELADLADQRIDLLLLAKMVWLSCSTKSSVKLALISRSIKRLSMSVCGMGAGVLFAGLIDFSQLSSQPF